MSEVSFTQIVQRGCGIDIHRDEAVATIGGEGLKPETRSYKTFSSSLTELKEWLIENGVTHVAMESTGVYWKPVYKVLECPELTVWIVNARHIKYVPGVSFESGKLYVYALSFADDNFVFGNGSVSDWTDDADEVLDILTGL